MLNLMNHSEAIKVSQARAEKRASQGSMADQAQMERQELKDCAEKKASAALRDCAEIQALMADQDWMGEMDCLALAARKVSLALKAQQAHAALRERRAMLEPLARCQNMSGAEQRSDFSRLLIDGVLGLMFVA
jgi:predicted transcriptional regulator